MARHRNIRNIDYGEYDDGDDSDGGFSGSPSSFSPSTQSHVWTRGGDKSSLADFIAPKGGKNAKKQPTKGGKKKDNEEEEDITRALHRDALSRVSEIVGSEFSEKEIKRALRDNNWSAERTTDALLKRTTESKPSENQFDLEMDLGDSAKTQVKKEGSDGKKAPVLVVEAKREVLEIKNPVPPTTTTTTTPSKPVEEVTEKVENLELGEDYEEEGTLPETPTTKKRKEDEKKFTKQMSVSRRREVEEMLKKKEEEKPHINLVVIGHVDAGKSTLMGHLLYLTGNVTKKLMHRYETDSKTAGKGSFMFAWVLDEHPDERARGITMDVAVSSFETPHRKITLLDAPGHRDFIPNMISGAAQADAAVLVIDASPQAFEAGFESDGQTKEHALLARALGIPSLIVAVNKLDITGWDKVRYEHIKERIGYFLKVAGYKDSSVTYLPVSALHAENILERKDPKLSSWFQGPTLIEAVDKIPLPTRDNNKPFRLSIQDIYKAQSAPLTIAGKVDTGSVSPGDKLLLLPAAQICTVKSIKSHSNTIPIASAGDNVDIAIQNIDPSALVIGDVVCDPEFPVPMVTEFEAQVLTFALPRPIIQGHTAELHMHSMSVPVVVSKLISILDKSSGEAKKKKPRALTDQLTALVAIRTNRPIPIELFSDCKPFGRFTLRDTGKTILAGIVTKITKKK